MRAAFALWLAAVAAAAGADDKAFDLLIRGGHVIDPKNGLDAVLDVAVAGGRIARVDASIPAGQARAVVDAGGLYVVPGLVDIHAHVFHGTEPDAYLSNGLVALAADGFTFRSGVTTVVDAGGAGWRNFRQFKEQVIDRSRTRVLAFLNIVGSGMKGGPVEQNADDMDARQTAARIAEFKDVIVGVKTAHYEGGWEAVDRAVEAATLAHVPVMVDFGKHDPPLPLDDLLLKRLRPGDIFTHAYADFAGRMTIVDDRGQVRPSVLAARKRGVLLDVGHGARSFSYRQAVPALAQGLLPDSISTDLHAESMNAGMKDMLSVMSKMMALGMSLRDVVLRATWNPARQIQHTELGHLSPGAGADVAVLRVRDGAFGFLDAAGERRPGSQRLEAELTVRDGQVVWDLNGLAAPATPSSPR